MRIFDRKEHEISILRDRLDIASTEQTKVRKLWVIFNSFGQAFVFIAKVCILSFGIISIYHGSITLGTLLFFIAFADRVYGPIFSVFEAYQNMMTNIAHYEKVQILFDMEDEKDNGKKVLGQMQKSITFENLSFSYPSSERAILSDISFEIKK